MHRGSSPVSTTSVCDLISNKAGRFRLRIILLLIKLMVGGWSQMVICVNGNNVNDYNIDNNSCRDVVYGRLLLFP